MWVNRKEFEALKNRVTLLESKLTEFKSKFNALDILEDRFNSAEKELENGELLSRVVTNNFFGWTYPQSKKANNVSEKIELLLKHLNLEVRESKSEKYLGKKTEKKK